jgi:hypothetical protein
MVGVDGIHRHGHGKGCQKVEGARVKEGEA